MEEVPGALDLLTTEELVDELIKRHKGLHRSLIISSCTPKEGTTGKMEMRSIVVANDNQTIINMLRGVTESLTQKPK